MRKPISILLILVILLAFFSGCKETSWIKPYDTESEVSVLSSELIAENKLLALSWDNERKGISLLSKETGKIWSTVSDEMESTLDIRVQNTYIRKEVDYTSSNAQRLDVKKIENGVKVTYYFDEISIAIPVCYTLREDSILISIDGKEIVQGGEQYQLISAEPGKMLLRTPITDEDSYIFIPTGTGGIVNTKVTATVGERYTSGYNSNIASMSVDSITNSSESSGFKCYGLKDGDSALFCIAEDTPGAIGINATAGNKIKSHSTVSSAFFFTDYDYFYGSYVLDGLIKQLSDPYQGVISVGVYPLSNEKADYNGMAECYRNYLIKSGYIKEKDVKNSSAYSITYMGGVLSTTSVLGIPKKQLNAMTTFQEAQTITEELTKATGVKPVVRLMGYGETGLNIGKIAGGYSFSSVMGSDKTRKAFEDYCKQNDISLYTDFGVLYYGKSGNGFSYNSDSARTAVLHAAEITPVNIPLRDFNNKLTYRLIRRDLVGKTVEKLISMASKKNVSGISLNDLGSVSYSDYSDGGEYAVTSKTETETKQYIENIIASGHKVGVSSATYFAAGLSDVVFDAPTEPNGAYIFEEDIPFYQMVFHGITPLYSTTINTASDIDYKLMLAASTGSGLSFGIINKFDTKFMETNVEKLYSMYYNDNKEFIISAVSKYEKIYNSVKDSKIAHYDILENNITKTTFENGVCIYANHSSEAQDSPIGKLAGYGFAVGGKE